MNHLILVRHGQSQWNKKKRFTGWVDIDLTEEGKSEAEYAGKLIKELNIEFHIFFTSQLKRATNTLSIKNISSFFCYLQNKIILYNKYYIFKYIFSKY